MYIDNSSSSHAIGYTIKMQLQGLLNTFLNNFFTKIDLLNHIAEKWLPKNSINV